MAESKESFGIYWRAYLAALQAKLEYRVDFVVGVVTSVMMQAASLSLLWILLRSAPSLAGWHPPEILYLFGMTAACLGGSELLFNQIWLLPYAIVAGDLDRLLTYPVRSLLFYLVTRPELHAFGNFLTGILYVGASLIWMQAPWYVWCAVPLFWLCGVLIYSSVLVWLGCLSFRFVGPYVSTMMIAHHLLQATRYPVATYPRAVQGLLLFVLPFGTFHYLPGAVLFGKGAPLVALAAAPLAALVAVWLAHKAWDLGLRRYESSGS